MTAGTVCVVGSFMMDLVAYTPRLPVAGETIIGHDFVQTPGGKGFNQAVACARAGVRTEMVGCLGDDSFADTFEDVLDAEHVGRTGVWRHERVGTGVGLPVVADGGENAIVVVPRSNRAISPADLDQQAPLITGADWLVLQLELDDEITLRAARTAAEAGVRVLLNPAPYAELSPELLDCVDLLVPNETEARAWVGVPAELPVEHLVEAVQGAADAHGVDVVLTLGSRGAVVISGGRSVEIAATPVEAVDTVGAGDAFCGWLVAELARGTGLVEAARTASLAAAISVTRRGGAAAPRRDEVQRWRDAEGASALA